MRIVFATQAADPEHPVLGATLANDPRSRRARRRGRRPRRFVRRRSAAGELRRAQLRGVVAGGPRRAIRRRARTRAASEAGGRSRAHVADLRVARGTARASVARTAAALVHAAGGRPVAADSGARGRSSPDGRRAEHSPALVEGARDRTRHRRRRPALRPGAPPAAAAPARSRPVRAGEGLGDGTARADRAARGDARAARPDAHRR